LFDFISLPALIRFGVVSMRNWSQFPGQGEWVLLSILTWIRDHDSSVGIVTCYRLDGLGIKCWWVQDFLRPLRMATYTMGTGSLSGGKVARAWR
jgi:hypothetical protein